MPATSPISMAPNGPMLMSAHVPTATPPAKVAFWMCTCAVERHKDNCMTELLLLTLWTVAVITIRVKLPDHVQFSFVLHQAGDGIGREHAGGQGEVGVDHCSELSVAQRWFSDGWVKAGPEHPQEDGSCRRGCKNGNVKVHAAQLSVSTRWHKSDFHWRPVMHQGGKVTGKKGKLSL